MEPRSRTTSGVPRRRARYARLLAALVIGVSFTLLATRSAAAVAAAGYLPQQGVPFAIANGTSPLVISYVGSTADRPERLGDQIRFTVSGHAGSLAKPKIRVGSTESTTLTVPLGGDPCTSTQDFPASPAGVPTRCFATVSIYSLTPGPVDIVMEDLTVGFVDRMDNAAEFYPQRLSAPVLNEDEGPDDQQTDEVAVQNVGSAAAIFVLETYDQDGVAIPTQRRVHNNVPPGAVRVISLPADNHQRVAVVGSDQPIVAQVHHAVPFSDGSMGTAIGGAASSPTTMTGDVVTLPFIANDFGGIHETVFTIWNTGAHLACVSVEYSFVPGLGTVGPEGRPPFVDAGPGGGGCRTGYAVPVNASIAFAPPFEIPDAIQMPEDTLGALMAATVTAEGSSVSVSVNAFWADENGSLPKEADYDGFLVSGTGPGVPQPAVGTNVTVPLALKTESGFYTQVLLSNPNAEPADVQIVYTGNTGTHTAHLVVPPHGVANHSVYSDNIVPLGFVGVATVVADQPVAAVLFRGKKLAPTSDEDEDVYTALNGIPVGNASTRVALPFVFRRGFLQPSGVSINSWISLSVVGGGVAHVTVRSVGSCGPTLSDAVYQTIVTITGSFIFYQNADADNGFSPTPPCFDGATIVTSDVPVIAAGSVLDARKPGDQEGIYNGIALP